MAGFTLVRHGAYALGGDAAFESAVEVCELSGEHAYRVKAAGGVVYSTRDAAEAAAMAVNHAGSLRARGYFSSLKIGGAEIHVPG